MTNLIRWNPAREMLTLRDEMDRLFDDFFGSPTTNHQQNSVNWGIPVDVREDQNSYRIEATMPGVSPENIDISINGNVLTVSAQTNSSQDKGDERYHIRERRFGRFSRTITLPQDINSDAVQADYENGVLTLQVPKSEEAKPRRISVTNRGGNQASQSQNTIDGQTASAKEQTMTGQMSGAQTTDNQSGSQPMETHAQAGNSASQSNGNQKKQQ